MTTLAEWVTMLAEHGDGSHPRYVRQLLRVAAAAAEMRRNSHVSAEMRRALDKLDRLDSEWSAARRAGGQ